MNADQTANLQQAIAPESQDSRGWGLSEPTLQEPCRVRQDLRLVQRAVKHRWPLKRSKCRDLADRLFEVVDKRAVSVVTKTGDIVTIDGPADVNAIAAARVIVAMSGQNQADEHHRDKLEQPDSGVSVNVSTEAGPQIYLPDNGRDDLSFDEKRNRLIAIARKLRANRLGESVQHAIGQEPEYLEWLRQRELTGSEPCKFGAVVVGSNSTQDSRSEA